MGCSGSHAINALISYAMIVQWAIAIAAITSQSIVCGVKKITAGNAAWVPTAARYVKTTCARAVRKRGPS